MSDDFDFKAASLQASSEAYDVKARKFIDAMEECTKIISMANITQDGYAVAMVCQLPVESIVVNWSP